MTNNAVLNFLSETDKLMHMHAILNQSANCCRFNGLNVMFARKGWFCIYVRVCDIIYNNTLG